MFSIIYLSRGIYLTFSTPLSSVREAQLNHHQCNPPAYYRTQKDFASQSKCVISDAFSNSSVLRLQFHLVLNWPVAAYQFKRECALVILTKNTTIYVPSSLNCPEEYIVYYIGQIQHTPFIVCEKRSWLSTINATHRHLTGCSWTLQANSSA